MGFAALNPSYTLNLWRRPLPQVLKEKIMDPIGASNMRA
jgi:hypothetical protein